MNIRKKCTDIIQDRIDGVYNDLKAFIYIRKGALEHKGTTDNIGGGNIVMGLSLFSALNFLGKCYYCVDKPNKFDKDGRTNETEVFIHFVKFLEKNKIHLGIPNDDKEIKKIWHGLRNYLAHLLTVEENKSLLTFIIDPEIDGSILDILDKLESRIIFEDLGNNSWLVNCDVLLAKLPQITNCVKEYISNSSNLQEEVLTKVIGIRI